MPYNPVINNTQRDPSTAWRDPATGEWRFTIYGGRVYGSMDFKTWYPSTGDPPFATGECPSFFPMPRAYPGAAPSAAPTAGYVNKFSSGGQDWMNVGDYSFGAVKSSGTYDIVANSRQLIDIGHFCECMQMCPRTIHTATAARVYAHPHTHTYRTRTRTRTHVHIHIHTHTHICIRIHIRLNSAGNPCSLWRAAHLTRCFWLADVSRCFQGLLGSGQGPPNQLGVGQGAAQVGTDPPARGDMAPGARAAAVLAG